MKRNHLTYESRNKRLARGGDFPSTAFVASHFDASTEAERIYAELYEPKEKHVPQKPTIRKFSWEEKK